MPERVTAGEVTEHGGGWNQVVQRIDYLSSADNTRQPMMFYKPQRDEPRPLLVGLHSWSENYTQDESAIYAEWCVANDWVFIHPDFRGPNTKPQATGSELVIGDVLKLSRVGLKQPVHQALTVRLPGRARAKISRVSSAPACFYLRNHLHARAPGRQARFVIFLKLRNQTLGCQH